MRESAVRRGGEHLRTSLADFRGKIAGKCFDVIPDSYLGMKFKADFVCNVCGYEWRTQAYSVSKKKYGCRKCADRINGENRRGIDVLSPEARASAIDKLTDRKHSTATRERMSAAKKGKVLSAEHRKNLSLNAPTYSCTNWCEAAQRAMFRKRKFFDGFKLYVTKLTDKNGDEEMLKIGRTFYKVPRRFYGIPYNVEVVKTVEGSAHFIFKKEWEIKRKLSNFKYIPKKKFGGSGECFSVNDQVLQSL